MIVILFFKDAQKRCNEFHFILLGPEPCEQQVDLCFVIDSSDSIRQANPQNMLYDNWALMRNFAAKLVDLFTIASNATRVGAVVFSENASVAFPLDAYNDAQSVKNAILTLSYLGNGTNTPKAFTVARKDCFDFAKGDRPNVQNLVIFISDGRPWPTTRTKAAKAEAQALKDANAPLIAIGVTEFIDEDFLKSVASPGQNYFTAADFTALTPILKSVGEKTCKIIESMSLFLSATVMALKCQNRIFSVLHALNYM